MLANYRNRLRRGYVIARGPIFFARDSVEVILNVRNQYPAMGAG